ncbi:hypothetical protein GBA65_18780 [Rubrobacter marinus]|uniref:Uncharacterized protein n=1 Tax=Rubrobacter marinus TaxID=2653852 RepID=A0A6G8Q175_9ACTN|nr:hypothetical protein [Rubrobacter marinus]QIN80226.1 hypothetical protein GBA65_18780 [Rubrobacter marinus]
MARKKEALRPDTTLAPAGRPEDEVYVRGLPVCCLGSLKEEILARPGGGRTSGGFWGSSAVFAARAGS